MIEVLVVEPDPLWRALITRALGRQDDLRVWPPLDGTPAAHARLDAHAARPGVAVIAAECDDICTRLVGDGVGVVLVYPTSDPASAADAWSRGARGCVPRAATAGMLSRTVLEVASGRSSYGCSS
ncbi:MAG TPA: hypothetical protein VN238_02095 [Solirubrobacteraceae bacterium]|nr:hypothetical protein [Solirubrobacteraceae bacterium]